jgi:hypothetical protein
VHVRALIRAYREKLWVLREFEGGRYLRWPAAAVGMFGVVWALPFAGGIASAYIARAGGGLALVALSVSITLALGGVRAAWSKRRPWWGLIADRADAYGQQGSPNDYARAMIPRADYDKLAHALRRAGLNYRATTAVPPPDAPTLNTRLEIYRPGICGRPGQEAVPEAASDVFRRIRVRGRINGQGFGGVPSFLASSPLEKRRPICATRAVRARLTIYLR